MTAQTEQSGAGPFGAVPDRAVTPGSLDRLTQQFVDRHPETCACIPVNRRQKAFYAAVAIFWLGLLLYRWDLWVLAITLFMSLWYLSAVLFRAFSVVMSLLGRGVVTVSPAALSSLSDEALPVYTILVPLYHESNIAGKIVSSLKGIDYPQEKLDVKLLLEADDTATQSAVAGCVLPPEYEVIVVPDGQPRTKPRACNYGLERAKGEFSVIYDAEDRPDADQLRKAVWAFREADDNLVCLQASLNYFNRKQNLLTRWFTIEYSTTFDLLLPGLQTLGVPVPLGGTSNHFRTAALRRVGGWDPFNVTEDCDLGVRLYTCGHRTSMLKSTTWEEANSRPWNWIRQRSRWVKGFLQTHLTYMRHPFRTWRMLGTRGLVGFYLAVGASSFMMVTNVVYWLLAGLYLGLLWHGGAHGQTLWRMVCGPQPLTDYSGVALFGGHLKAWPLLYLGADQSHAWSMLSVALFSTSMVLLCANLFFVLVHVMACFKRRYFDLLPAALIMPLYWVLISVGAWKGFIQLFTKPFYWEKTIHGLDEEGDAEGDVEGDDPSPDVAEWRKPAFRGELLSIALLLLCGLGLAAGAAPVATGGWLARGIEGADLKVSVDDKGVARASVPAAGGTVMQRADAGTFRARREAFDAATLELDVQVNRAVEGHLYVQTSDGLWFQTRRTVALPSGTWHTVTARLTARGGDFEPQGHRGSWHALEAVEIRTVGVKLAGAPDDAARVAVACRPPRWSGRRQHPALEVYAWDLADAARLHHPLESRFGLTREYFNPFDPEEVQVDAEIRFPDGSILLRPAFFAQGYQRRLVGMHEEILPDGAPYWAFRFTPMAVGRHAVRLRVREGRSAGAGSSPRDAEGEHAPAGSAPGELMETGWRDVEVADSDARGFVRVSPRDPRYFEFLSGECFFPIGLNLHTIQDLRGDRVVEGPPTIDQGTYTFDAYFDQMGTNGVTAVELWMAAWSLGLEWSRAKPGYRGVGRYHLGNAWRLDHVLSKAREQGIYVNLVLDNHGKLSDHSDPEWSESPFNRGSPHAVADGAVLDFADSFFSSGEAWRFNTRRNRYIAARWGAEPAVMGVEFWSEFNLITAFDRLYRRGEIEEWVGRAARQWREWDPWHLLTVHFSGDYENNIRYARVDALPEVDYVVSDAYRGGEVPMTEQMARHDAALAHFGKPLLITEYGGNWSGSSHNQMEADLHTGLWASFFTHQAGTPLLWWHAFVHRMNRYGHYRGLSRYLADVDPIGRDFQYRTATLTHEGGEACERFVVLLAGTPDEEYAWIARRSELMSYRPDEARRPAADRAHRLTLSGLHARNYCAEWWDPLTGSIRESVPGLLPDAGTLTLAVPAVGRDVALKLRPEPQGGTP